MSKSKLSQRDIDDQFEAFLRESVSSESSLESSRINKYLNQKKKAEERPWWMRDEESGSSLGGTGLSGTGRSFMKSKKVVEEKDTNKNQSKPPSFTNTKTIGQAVDLSLSKDSLDTVTLFQKDETKDKGLPGIPALSLDTSQSYTDTGTAPEVKPAEIGGGTLQYGADTLDEIAEKEKFFRELEESGSDIDYGKLNAELDQSATIATTNTPPLLRRGAAQDSSTDDIEDDADESHYKKEPIKSVQSQGHHDIKQANLLSQVSLSDSLNSTLDTKPAGSRDMQPIPEDRDAEERESRLPARAPARHMEESDEEEDVHETHPYHRTETTSKWHTDENYTTDATSKWQRETADSTSKWETGKTLPGTETSLEMEALHAALKEVGMSTLGTLTKEFSLPETLPHEARESHDQPQTSQDTGTAASAGPTGATPAFGFHKILPAVPKEGTDNRTVEDIIREVEELQEELKKKKNEQTSDEDAGNESRGFDLSPVHTPKHKDTQHGKSKAVIVPVESGSSLPPSPSKSDRLVKKKSKSKFDNVKSSGYGQKGSPPHKPKASSSPMNVSKQRTRGSESRIGPGQSSAVGNQVASPVQSFGSYIQQQNLPPASPVRPLPQDNFTHSHLSVEASHEKLSAIEREKALLAEVKEWQDQWKTERKMYTKLKADMLSQEKEHHRFIEQMKIDHEHEVFKLKQDNFVLSAKVAESGTQSELKKKVMDGQPLEGASKQQLELLEKEVREQEKLLIGYQQENERLYMELKRAQTSTKMSEERMFKENQRLTKEVTNLREELERKSTAYENRGVITSQSMQQQIAATGGAGVTGAVLGAGRIAQLEAELKQARQKLENLQREAEISEKTKVELETHIDTLIRNREKYEEKVNVSKTNKVQEMMKMEQKYQSEIDRLNRKLKWYAENQELLDGDAQRIQEKNLEIQELKSKIETLGVEAGKKKEEVQSKSRERATDAKKILDLERQVKEMENIIRKRHPNSLPVLMWAASTVPDQQPAKAPSVQYLENRIGKLERDLEEKDEEAKRSLRAMEQKHLALKFQYEERIDFLESQRPGSGDRTKNKDSDHPHTHTLALQKELDATRERFKKKISGMETDMDKLKKELAAVKNKEESGKSEHSRMQDQHTELEVRLRTMQTQITERDKDLQLQKATIERLQKEKHEIYMDAARSLKGKKGKALSKVKKSGTQDESPHKEITHNLAAYQEMFNPNKTYEPNTFTGLHIEDVIQENEALKTKIDHLMIEGEQQRMELRKSLALSEATVRKSHEELDQQITALKLAHKADVERLLTEHAMTHSTSRLAELQSKLDTQEVVIKHLKQQLAQNTVDSEKTAVLKIRETALETQVKQLNEDLREARKSHTPQMKHFEALTEKITQMENRHSQREQELKQIITQTKLSADQEIHLEASRWQQVIQTKNGEIQRFRAELDSILEVLRELHRQGVVIPTRSAVRYT